MQKMPEEFGVHFRREGVLHEVQKLTDPDNPICVTQFSESPLGATWSASSPGASAAVGASGRSWTVAGSSLANMFPDQLRVPKRRDNHGVNNESSSSADTSSPQAPLRLSDMLKRKRVSKRSSNRKGRHSDGGATAHHEASASPTTSSQLSTSLGSSPPTHGYDMPQLVTQEMATGKFASSCHCSCCLFVTTANSLETLFKLLAKTSVKLYVTCSCQLYNVFVLAPE